MGLLSRRVATLALVAALMAAALVARTHNDDEVAFTVRSQPEPSTPAQTDPHAGDPEVAGAALLPEPTAPAVPRPSVRRPSAGPGTGTTAAPRSLPTIASLPSLTGPGVLFAFGSPGGPRAGITAGPDGNLWYAASQSDVVGRVTPEGVITEFHTPTPDSRPSSIAVGPDGNLWFTEFEGNRIGHITQHGVITEFGLAAATSRPHAILAGPDGKMWFLETERQMLGRITMAGAVSETPLLDPHPVAMTRCPTKGVWVASLGANDAVASNTLAHIVDPDHVVRQLVPNPWVSDGPIHCDGTDTLWLSVTDYLGEVTGLMEWPQVPGPSINVYLALEGYDPVVPITTGRDGRTWYAKPGTKRIGYLGPDNTTLAVVKGAAAYALSPGPGRTLWFTTTDAVGRITLP